MNTIKKTTPSPEGQKQLETLRQAVDKTLEKKRRLGQGHSRQAGLRPWRGYRDGAGAAQGLRTALLCWAGSDLCPVLAG